MARHVLIFWDESGWRYLHLKQRSMEYIKTVATNLEMSSGLEMHAFFDDEKIRGTPQEQIPGRCPLEVSG